MFDGVLSRVDVLRVLRESMIFLKNFMLGFGEHCVEEMLGE